MGRAFDNQVIQTNVDHWPFTVKNVGNELKIEVLFKKKVELFYPEEISSMILAKAKETAEAYLGKEVTGAVITVPANFNNSQRQATLDAGSLAGFNELRLINEPTAAAIVYGLKRQVTVAQNILVLHLGGGYFDVSILTIENDVIEVKSTIGQTNFGGEDFTNRLTKHVIEFAKAENFAKFAHSQPEHDFGRIENAVIGFQMECEHAKIAHTSSKIAKIEIGSSSKNGEEDDNYLKVSLSRARFEKLNADFFRTITDSVERALISAEMEKSYIDDIVLVGESSNMPEIQSLLQDFFSGKYVNHTCK